MASTNRPKRTNNKMGDLQAGIAEDRRAAREEQQAQARQDELNNMYERVCEHLRKHGTELVAREGAEVQRWSDEVIELAEQYADALIFNTDALVGDGDERVFNEDNLDIVRQLTEGVLHAARQRFSMTALRLDVSDLPGQYADWYLNKYRQETLDFVPNHRRPHGSRRTGSAKPTAVTATSATSGNGVNAVDTTEHLPQVEQATA